MSSELDFQDRKLQYLNAKARDGLSLDEHKELDEKYHDVVLHLRGADQPAKKPVFSPVEGAVPKTLEHLIAHFGAREVAMASLEQLSPEDVAAITADGNGKLNLTPVSAVLYMLPALSLEELNKVLDALGPLMDAGGAKPPAKPDLGELEGWRDLQWKKQVALANKLKAPETAEAENADQARAILEALETAALAKAD